MNSNTLNDFRHEIYRRFGKAKDVLFNLVDALASEAGARSFPELSLSPLFERTWASLYEALEDGQIDAIASTSRNCSGTLHGSRPRSAPNAGHNWWPVRTICRSWLVPWWKAATARGKTDVRNSR